MNNSKKRASAAAAAFPKTVIGIPLFEGFDSLDVAGAQQVFYTLNSWNVDTVLIGPEKDKVVVSFEGIQWTPVYGYGDHPKLDVIYVPGGADTAFQTLASTNKGPFYDFLKKAAKDADLICSVCTGALLLAQAGLLDGFECTTHWAYKAILSLYPKIIVAPGFPRYVIDRNRVTGGGISSTIDEAFAIAAILRGEEAAKQVQLIMQYAPDPPFHSGDPSQAGPATLQDVSNRMGTTEFYELVQKGLKGKKK